MNALEITTTAGCKVTCSYCPQALFALEHKKAGGQRMLTRSVFEKCLASVPASVHIHFSGYTEPFLNPECMAFIRHSYRKGHPVAVYTTLVGMQRDHVDELVSMRLEKLKIHLPDEGTHMRVEVDDDYLGKLNALLSSSIGNLQLISYFTMHPLVARLLADREWRTDELTSRAGNVTTNVVKRPTRLDGVIRCTENRLTRNVLLPNGDVALCCVDFGRQHVIGNLLSDRYDDLHKSDAFNEILARMNGAAGPLLCRTCEWAETV